jgi:uncharacterized protein YegP (UPF0339 family)
MYRFEIFRDASASYGWRLVTPSGYVVAVGDDRYRTPDIARRAVGNLQAKVSTAEIAVAPNAA